MRTGRAACQREGEACRRKTQFQRDDISLRKKSKADSEHYEAAKENTVFTMNKSLINY